MKNKTIELLKESLGNYHEVKSVYYRCHGEWSDGEILYRGYSFNENDVIDIMWDDFLDIYGIKYIHNGYVLLETGEYKSEHDIDLKFDIYFRKRLKQTLREMIDCGCCEKDCYIENPRPYVSLLSK